MGYNSVYGLPKNDSVTRYEISKNESTINFLEEDELGLLHVKSEYGACAECGKSFEKYEMIYQHGTKELCRKCEYKLRNKQRKINKLKKAVKK